MLNATGRPIDHLHLITGDIAVAKACDAVAVQTPGGAFDGEKDDASWCDELDDKNGGPGERGDHRGCHGAFVLDPDSNDIAAVFHDRSSP